MTSLEQMRAALAVEMRDERRRALDRTIETFDAAAFTASIHAKAPRARAGRITCDQVAEFIAGLRWTLDHYPRVLHVNLIDGRVVADGLSAHADRIELARGLIRGMRLTSVATAPSWPFCGVRKPDSATENDRRWEGAKHELARCGWSAVGGVWRPPNYGKKP